jgi:hypothetical protein
MQSSQWQAVIGADFAAVNFPFTFPHEQDSVPSTFSSGALKAR